MSQHPFLGLGFNSWTQKFGRDAASAEEGGGGGDSFVAVNKIVVGKPYGNQLSNFIRPETEAYVYNLDGTGEVMLTSSDAVDGDRLGQSVGLGTNRIAVGAPHADPSGSSSGKVYLYNLSGTEVGIITASDGAGGDNFGYSVAIGNNKIVVGAYNDDDTASNTGSVYVYNLDGTGEVKITASDPASFDRFGDVVAVGSNRIVVGAHNDDDDGSASGAVYVYNLDGTNEVKITASDAASGDEFGHGVAIGNNKIVVGSPNASIGSTTSGAVYVYNLDGTGEVKITPSDGSNDDFFGRSVGIGTNKIVVGSPLDDDATTDAGAAYVYNLDGTGEVKITASDASFADQFGTKIAIGNNKIVVGCPFTDDDGNSSGSAYVYNLDGTNEVKITASDARFGQFFGQAVAVG